MSSPISLFKRLHQKILWKIDLNSLDDIPKNVMIRKWIPQLEVLVHPNCQLFITHGGLFSHHEAIYAGVPTVGIPFFADQPYNLLYNVIKGNGLKLDFLTLDENTLYSAVSTVLTNKSYKEAAVRPPPWGILPPKAGIHTYVLVPTIPAGCHGSHPGCISTSGHNTVQSSQMPAGLVCGGKGRKKTPSGKKKN